MPACTPTFKPVRHAQGRSPYYSDMETHLKALMTVQASRRCSDVSLTYTRPDTSCGMHMTPAEARALAGALVAAADAAAPPEHALGDEDARYAINRSVPDMARGFTIQTSYGDLVVPAGWLADRVSSVVATALELQLATGEEQP